MFILDNKEKDLVSGGNSGDCFCIAQDDSQVRMDSGDTNSGRCDQDCCGVMSQGSHKTSKDGVFKGEVIEYKLYKGWKLVAEYFEVITDPEFKVITIKNPSGLCQ